MSSPTIKTSGNIAIVWGTTNSFNGNAGVNGTLIDSIRITPKNGTPTDIEGGEGATKLQVFLDDGFDATVTATYDSNIAVLAAGSNVVMVVPKADGNAGTRNVNCSFWSWGWDKNKKQEGKINITITHRPDINT